MPRLRALAQGHLLCQHGPPLPAGHPSRLRQERGQPNCIAPTDAPTLSMSPQGHPLPAAGKCPLPHGISAWYLPHHRTLLDVSSHP